MNKYSEGIFNDVSRQLIGFWRKMGGGGGYPPLPLPQRRREPLADRQLLLARSAGQWSISLQWRASNHIKPLNTNSYLIILISILHIAHNILIYICFIVLSGSALGQT